MPSRNKPKKSVCGVKVCTWGTEYNAGNGMLHLLDTAFFGGNVGHAAIQLTFPANEEGERLVKEYCEGTDIPFTKKKIVTKDKMGKVVFEEEVYEVFWSWWGSSEPIGHHLTEELEQDAQEEWMAVNFDWNEKWKEIINPEARHFKGKLGLGDKVITHGPKNVIHAKNLKPEQIADLKSYFLFEDSKSKIGALDLLKIRLQSGKKGENGFCKLGKTEILILNRLIPNWESVLQDSRFVSLAEITLLLTKIESVKKPFETVVNVSLKALLPDLISSLEAQNAAVNLKDNRNVELRANLFRLNYYLPAQARFKDIATFDEYKKLLAAAIESSSIFDVSGKRQDKDASPMYKLVELLNKMHAVEIDPDEMSKLKSEVDKIINGITNPEAIDIFKKFNKDVNSLKKEAELNFSEENMSKILIFCQKKQKELQEEKMLEIYENPDKLDIIKNSFKAFEEYVSGNGDKNSILTDPDMVDVKTMFDGLNDALAPETWESLLDYFPVQEEGELRNEEQNQEIMSILKKKLDLILSQTEMLKDFNPKKIGFSEESGDYDVKQYLTKGLMPDNVVRLPIARLRNADVGHESGLNVEGMLKKMKALTSDKVGFSMTRKNCSSTTASILEAGGTNEYQKNFFRNKAFAFYDNPQEVYNNALKLQDAFKKNNGKPSIIDRIFPYNPVERMGGAFMYAYKWSSGPGEKAPLWQRRAVKAGSMLAGLVVIPVVFSVFAIRKILNPLKTVKGGVELINYAFSRNSKAIKAITAIVVSPVVAILSPLAVAQYGIKKAIVDPIRSLTKTRNKTYKRLESKIKEEQLDTLSDEEKQQSIDAEIEEQDKNQSLKAVMDNLSIEIEAKPEEAITKFAEALNKNLIPVFSKKSEAAIIKYMNKHPEEKVTFDRLVMQRMEAVNKAVKYFKEQWKNDKPPTPKTIIPKEQMPVEKASVAPEAPILLQHNEQHDQEVLDVLEKAAKILEVQKQKSSSVLTRLEHERERTQLASQLVQEPKMFIMLQQAFFNSVMSFGKDLMHNTIVLDKQGAMNTVQRDTLGAVANTLMQELPFMQMDNPENVKKGFVLFVSTLQSLNQFSKENPDLMLQIGDKIQIQLEALQSFITNSKAKISDANITDTLRDGLLGRFMQLEEHVQKITKQLKPIEQINEVQIKTESRPIIEKQFCDLISPIGETLLKVNLECREKNVPTSKQAELEKLGQAIMGLPFELLTQKKNMAKATEELGKSLKNIGNFLKDNSEIAVNIGSRFCKALKPVFDFLKNTTNVPEDLKQGLSTLAIEAEELQNVFENQARFVIQNQVA